MKRIIAALALILLLPCCSAQNSVDTPLLIKRLCSESGLTMDDRGIFYDGKSGRCALVNKDENTVMLSTELAGNNTAQVSGARLTLAFNSKWSNKERIFFINTCENLISVFAFEETESTAEIMENLMYNEDGKNIYKFYDTERYTYSLIKTNVGADFCCKSKRLSSDDITELTLSVPSGTR